MFSFTLAYSFLPEPGSPPLSLDDGNVMLAVGAGAAGVLFLIWVVGAVRARRFSYSLRGFMAFCLALGLALGGLGRGYRARQLAREQRWVALIDGDLIVESQLRGRTTTEVAQKLDEFKASKIATKQWDAQAEGNWVKVSRDVYDSELQSGVLELVMLKQARRDGIQVDPKQVDWEIDRIKKERPEELKGDGEEKARAIVAQDFVIGKFVSKLRLGAPPPSDAEVEQFYKAHPNAFQKRPQDDVKPLADVFEKVKWHLTDLRQTKAVEDWQRAALQRAAPKRFVDGKWEEVPVEFFFK